MSLIISVIQSMCGYKTDSIWCMSGIANALLIQSIKGRPPECVEIINA